MHAIVRVAGVQARVAPGDTVRVPRMDVEVGTTMTLGEVLLVSDGENVTVGTPVVPGVQVEAEVLAHKKDKKIHVFKKKRRKRYRVFRGHRQQYTEVLVKSLGEGAAVDASELPTEPEVDPSELPTTDE